MWWVWGAAQCGSYSTCGELLVLFPFVVEFLALRIYFVSTTVCFSPCYGFVSIIYYARSATSAASALAGPEKRWRRAQQRPRCCGITDVVV